jgi:hypothetical protein
MAGGIDGLMDGGMGEHMDKQGDRQIGESG